MGIRIKFCTDCKQKKRIGASKSRCKACRKANPFPIKQDNTACDTLVKSPTKPTLKVNGFENWKPRHLPKCLNPHNKKYSTISLGKKQRNIVLLAYGHKNYNVYLQSDLWLSIRARVLKDNAVCVCGCGRLANQVHHKAYTESNLLGESLRGLVPINNDCHYKIEFCGERKTSLGEANYNLKKLQRNI